MTGEENHSGRQYSIPYQIESVQAVIKERCSDAREVGSLDWHIAHILKLEYLIRGVDPIKVSRSNAGSFMTGDTIPEIKGVLHGFLRRYSEFFEKDALELVVQIYAHGDVELTCQRIDDHLLYAPDELRIVPDSPINCGMRHAAEAWGALAELIISEGKAGKGINTSYFDKKAKSTVERRIDTKEALLHLLKNMYAYTGSSTDSFVSSIEDIIQHPLNQKALLRKALDTDVELGGVPIHINAGVVNYRTGLCARVDRNNQVYTFLDDTARLRMYIYGRDDLLGPEDEERRLRACKQTECVRAGLLCPDSLEAPRTKLAKWLTAQGTPVDVSGGVFGIISDKVLHNYSTFGAYKLVAFFYSVSSLNLRDYYVIGKDEDELRKMRQKLDRDPIMCFVIKHFNVRIHCMTESRMLAEIQGNGTEEESKYAKIVRTAFRDFKPSDRSVLAVRPAINKELTRLRIR